jgi:hypothetical protein
VVSLQKQITRENPDESSLEHAQLWLVPHSAPQPRKAPEPSRGNRHFTTANLSGLCKAILIPEFLADFGGTRYKKWHARICPLSVWTRPNHPISVSHSSRIILQLSCRIPHPFLSPAIILHLSRCHPAVYNWVCAGQELG